MQIKAYIVSEAKERQHEIRIEEINITDGKMIWLECNTRTKPKLYPH